MLLQLRMPILLRFLWSLQFSHSVVSNSLWPHRLLHARLPIHHKHPEATETTCPLCWWCHRNISSSIVRFSSHLESFLAAGPFPWVDSSHQMAEVLKFQLPHQSFHRHSVLISFRMDWLDLLAVQGTFKSLLQHHSSKASILQWSAFFIVQLSHLYMTTGKICWKNY